MRNREIDRAPDMKRAASQGLSWPGGDLSQPSPAIGQRKVFMPAIISVHPAALFRLRGSKRMSRREPVASASRSSVRNEGRVRPLSRRATTG